MGWQMDLVPGTMEPQFNIPLCNKVLNITNKIPHASNSKIICGKEPCYHETLL